MQRDSRISWEKIEKLSKPFAFLVKIMEFLVEVKALILQVRLYHDVFKTSVIEGPPYFESCNFLSKAKNHEN